MVRVRVRARVRARLRRVAEGGAVLGLVILLEARQLIALRAARHEGGCTAHEVEVVAHLLGIGIG